MATARALLVASLVLSCFLLPSHGTVLFSSLQGTLTVKASTTSQQVLKAGVDKITVTWELNQSFPAGTDSSYKTIKVKLCYARISQVDRPWRKTEDLLEKDRTCPHKVAARPYNPANGTIESLDWTVPRDVPTATYFIRAYAHDADDKQVAFGQTTDATKTTDLFQVQAISGRQAAIDICSICFSVFSVVSLFGFFYNEKRKAH